MAILETKIIQVSNSPEIINSFNEENGSFGWSVQNIQVTHSQDTKTYTKTLWDVYSGDKTVETTTINYATITYQRDKKMDNYDRIAALEREYDQLAGRILQVKGEGEHSKSIGVVLLWCLFIWPYGLYLLFKWFKESKELAAGADDRRRRIEELINRRETVKSEAERLCV